ncbi:ABC transporter substrate-binding protein [Oceanimonas sp. NS1]|nr:ABC transporter substrate-binding protein [Oceanimonas sp. NS1]
MIWGLAATSLMLMDEHDMLAPYAPAGLEQLSAEFRDARDTPHWVGMNAWLGVICYNTIEAEKHGLTKPSSWQDLTKPEYQGHIVMPNPASSGTGFLDVSAWLQQFGEDKGWAYMDGLHQNIANYTHSGSKPCVQAASGEATIGISMAYRGPASSSRAPRWIWSSPVREWAGKWKRRPSSRAPTMKRRRKSCWTSPSPARPTSSIIRASRWLQCRVWPGRCSTFRSSRPA